MSPQPVFKELQKSDVWKPWNPTKKKIEDELFEERRKVHHLENAMKEREKFISDFNTENETIRERSTRLEQELQLVMKQLADLKCEKSRAKENQAENAEADNKKPYSKPKSYSRGRLNCTEYSRPDDVQE